MKLVHDPLWRDRWEWIRKGLEEVRARATPALPWLPEDIYHALTASNAALCPIGEGFCVVQTQVSSYERVLFVWVLWAPAGTMLRHKHELMTALEVLARELNCKRIRMHSTRDKEWVAMNLFVPVSTIFEREVTK